MIKNVVKVMCVFSLADNIDRIVTPGYEPSPEDILRYAGNDGIVERD